MTPFSLASPDVRRPRRSSARPTQTGRMGEGIADKNQHAEGGIIGRREQDGSYTLKGPN